MQSLLKTNVVRSLKCNGYDMYAKDTSSEICGRQKIRSDISI